MQRGDGGPSDKARAQHRVWETIADSFDATRDRTWEHVRAFVQDLPAGARVLDLMAGNGRHAAVALHAGTDVVALDWSRPLMRRCAERGVHAVAGDATHLPLADHSFDAAIVVAGLHGIPSEPGRLACLQELRRVLRPGAPVQVTVWNRQAPRFADAPHPDRPVDVVVPWKADGHDEERTYHLYTEMSLADHLAQAGFTDVTVAPVSIAADDDNLVATATAPD